MSSTLGAPVDSPPTAEPAIITSEAKTGGLSHIFFFLNTAATEDCSRASENDSSHQVLEAMVPSIVAAGQNPYDDSPGIPTPADSENERTTGEILSEACRIMTAASIHLAANGEPECATTALSCAAAAAEKAAVAEKDSHEPPSDDGMLAHEPSNAEGKSTNEDILAVASRTLLAASTHLAANAESECAATALKCANAAQEAANRIVNSQKVPEYSSMTDSVIGDESSRSGAVEEVTEPEHPTLNNDTAVESAFELATETLKPAMNNNESADKPTETDASNPATMTAQKTSKSTQAIVDEASASLSSQTSSSDIVAPTESTESSQQSLTISVTDDKSTKSGASSPSKTSPLSVSAAEFVPFDSPTTAITTGVSFGPERPPTPAITATAAEFVPSAPAKAKATHKREPRRKFTPANNVDLPFFEQRETPDRGIGLFAVRKIPVGTRIICEAPLLKISKNNFALTLKAYCGLSPKQKKIYDSLHAYAPPDLDLEKKIPQDLREAGDQDAIARHVRVMSIFCANDFLLANQHALGVFETVSRINHSCVPNVHFSNNAELNGKETVHAACDIEEGQELLANYIGGRSNYWCTGERQEYLFFHYGFWCQCDACSGAIEDSDVHRQRLHDIVWGLNEYKCGTDETMDLHGSNPFFPANPLAAFKQAEDAFRILIMEGLVTSELCKAYRFLSDFALDLGQHETALHYAFFEQKVERNIFGTELGDLKKLGLASEQWISSIQLRFDADGVPMPGPKFWEQFPDKKASWYTFRRGLTKLAEEDEKTVEIEKMKAESKKAKYELKRLKWAKKREERRAAQKAKTQEMQSLPGQGQDKEKVDAEEKMDTSVEDDNENVDTTENSTVPS
jgi:hypothetical protein